MIGKDSNKPGLTPPRTKVCCRLGELSFNDLDPHVSHKQVIMLMSKGQLSNYGNTYTAISAYGVCMKPKSY